MGNAENDRDVREAWQAATRDLARELGVEPDDAAKKPARRRRYVLGIQGTRRPEEKPPSANAKALEELRAGSRVLRAQVIGKRGNRRIFGPGTAIVKLSGAIEGQGNVTVSGIHELAQKGIITIRPPKGGKEVSFILVPVGKQDRAAEPLAKVSAEAFKPQPRSDAILRALQRGRTIIEQDLEAAGGTYSTREVADYLKITVQAVHKQVRAGRLLSVQDNEGKYRFPAFQLTRPAVRPHLPSVLKRLKTSDSFIKLHWLLTKDSRLGSQRPVDLLERGEVEPVLRAADEFGEHVPA